MLVGYDRSEEPHPNLPRLANGDFGSFGRPVATTTLYARDSQFKPFCGQWNLWSKTNLERDAISVKITQILIKF